MKLGNHIFFSVALQPPWAKAIIEDSLSHTDTQHWEELFWTSDQPDAETSTRQHTTLTKTNIHSHGRIWTRNTNKRAAADPRFRPRGHWDRQGTIISLRVTKKERNKQMRLLEVKKILSTVWRHMWGKEVSFHSFCNYKVLFVLFI
jgi:hypothetical protein